MESNQSKPKRARQPNRWLRLLWVVGCLAVGCALTPGSSGGLSSATQGIVPKPTLTSPLTPDSSGGLGNATQGSVPKPTLTSPLTPDSSGGLGNATQGSLPKSTLTPSPFSSRREETCEEAVCILEVEFPFQRPIQPPGTDTVDPTYRYGSTQNGEREVHHGVEFINKAGVPIYAVADGAVEFAGEDEQVSLATKRGFYGKVIILKHRLQGWKLPLYSVYGHVLKILVEKGETVQQGEQIGEVGLGGVAAGTHLHFEVRYGKNDYDATRNPELWLTPALPDSGILIGRFLDSQNECLTMENIVLEPLGMDDAAIKRRYFATYEDPEMRCLPPWEESFGINDLPAGRYRLSYIYTKPEIIEFEILAGKVTFLDLRLP